MKIADIIKALESAINEATQIAGYNDEARMRSMLRRWIDNTGEFIRTHLGEDECASFNNSSAAADGGFDPCDHLKSLIHHYKTHLDVLRLELINKPEVFERRTKSHNSVKPVIKKDKHTIFLVHGRDELPLEKTRSFLRELGFEVVVLKDKPNGGKTIIEKFERYADVDYAVVLATPDDVGRLKTADANEERTRARQNVIFELGFFVGKIGRGKVCLLKQGDPDLPSDLQGVVYISLDASDWQRNLASELVDAGLKVDASKLIKS